MMKTHKKSIERIMEVVKQKSITPTEFRYICTQVRLKCNLIIPSRKKKLPDYLNAAEIYTFLNVASQNNLTGLLAEFLVFTGLRISEARNLLVQDIDFNNNQLKVVKGKTGDRYVPISSNLLHKIKLYLNKRNKGYLFCKSNEKMYTVRAFQKRIKKALLLCNFNKDLHTHSLRHTYACLCLARGIDLKTISVFLGHSSIITTEIYAKLELGSKKEEYLQLIGGL